MTKASIKDLKPGAHIHLIGICGTAMASLAGLLKDRGYKVTGSDLNPYPPMSTQIESMGIQIQRPYKKENLYPKPDFVVVGNVVSAHNEEAIEMKNLNLPYCSLPQAMGDVIIAERDCFVVSGTHGKTTTTSLMSWTAELCGMQPGFLIGGIPKNFSQSFRNPTSQTFVIEGDEYDTAFFDKVPKFIYYRPKYVILTSVEFDHADIYKDFNAVKAAFLKLMNLIPEEGALVFWGDDKNVADVASHCKIARSYSYGFNESNDYTSTILSESVGNTQFKVKFKGQDIGVYETPMVGRYNILNATAVVAQAHLNNWPNDKIKESLISFQGVKRRQEVLGEFDGVLIIEDFAHHPTAVKETVKAIQAKYSDRKVFSVFEPRSATSRRKVFQKDYVDALGIAHEVLLARPFDQSKISEHDRFSTDELIQDLKNSGKSAEVYDNADSIVSALIQKAKIGDVILIMSNGGFDGIYDKLISKLKHRSAIKSKT